MNNIISSVLLSAGKQIIGGLTGSNQKQVDRTEQLQRFDQRLDFVTNPKKNEFKTFLKNNHAENTISAEYLQKRLKKGLLHQPELSQFVSGNGGLSAPLTIEKSNSGYTLANAAGEIVNIEKGSAMEGLVDKLYHLESVLQLAAVDPGVSLDKVIDLSFENDQLKPVSRVNLS